MDPATGHTIRYVHDPADPTSIAANRINFAAEDRTGRFWIASSGGLDEFDRKTGKVIRRAAFRSEVSQFHEDRSGVFWMTSSTDSSCTLATLSLKTNLVSCHSIDYKSSGVISPVTVSAMLESRDGTMWLSSSFGLLKLDRKNKQIISYRNHPSDNESLESNHVISIYQRKKEIYGHAFRRSSRIFLLKGRRLLRSLHISAVADRGGCLVIDWQHRVRFGSGPSRHQQRLLSRAVVDRGH